MAGWLAPRVRQEAPGWAKQEEKPLFTFAWISDLHLDESRQEFIAKAFRFVDAELKPDFVLITGDNNALPAPPANPNQPESLALRRQLFFKAYLQRHLKTPYVLIPGDNWPHEFDKVFGPVQYSFDYGGLHFLLTAPDREFRGAKMEGLAVFDEATWTWMRKDLEKNRGKPVILALHEPVFPPTFLDARRLRQLLDGYPNVIACFHGHLHVDMELERAGRKYLICPALGPTAQPAMKLVKVFPRILILRTIEYRKVAERFEIVNKWQKIDVPGPLGKRLARPPDNRFAMRNYDSVPAHARRTAPELAGRVDELVGIVREFLVEELPEIVRHRAASW